MVNYRRNRVAGGTYFFTVTLRNRRADFLTAYFAELKLALRATHQEKPFETVAMVVLPQHLHVVWTLPAEDADYENRWRKIKSHFTQLLLKAGVALNQNARGEYDLWQARFWEHTIRDERDLQHHVAYIYHNPVKHGWAKNVADWAYSTFHRDVVRGLFPANWSADVARMQQSGIRE